MNRAKAEMGILVTLEGDTGPMRKEAAEAGWYVSEGWGRDYPKMQILTIEDLLAGKVPDLSPARQTFTKAEKVKAMGPAMAPLFADE